MLHAQEEMHHGEHHKKVIMAELFAAIMVVDSPQQMRMQFKENVSKKIHALARSCRTQQ
jgi:hypothetical protein